MNEPTFMNSGAGLIALLVFAAIALYWMFFPILVIRRLDKQNRLLEQLVHKPTAIQSQPPNQFMRPKVSKAP